jgi:hypothetical protein
VDAVRQPTPQPIVFKVLRDFLRDHDFTDQEKKVVPLIIREIPSADSLFQDSLVPLGNISLYIGTGYLSRASAFCFTRFFVRW